VLQCNNCQKVFVEPVTVIPCGHSYCLKCKVGYTKNCTKCGPNSSVIKIIFKKKKFFIIFFKKNNKLDWGCL
jgi:hypothetical protein